MQIIKGKFERKDELRSTVGGVRLWHVCDLIMPRLP